MHIFGEEVPRERSGHSLVASKNGTCYLFGGFCGERCLSELFKLSRPFEDLKAASWTRLSSVGGPSARVSHSACACKDGMFVFGGSGPLIGSSSHNDSFFYSFDNDTWTCLDDASTEPQVNWDQDPMLFGRYASSAFVASRPEPGYGRACAYHEPCDCVMIFGGTDGYQYDNRLWVFHMPSRTWYLLKHFSGNAPSARYLAKACVMCLPGEDEKLIILGGDRPPFTNVQLQIHELNLRTLTWTCLSFYNDETVPLNRIAHGVCQVNPDTILLYGGCGRRSPPTDPHASIRGGNIRQFSDYLVHSDAWLYSHRNRMFTRLDKPSNRSHESPGPLEFHTCVSVGQGRDIIVFGGCSHGERKNDTYIYRLQATMFTLTELCLTVIKHSFVANDQLEEPIEDVVPTELMEKYKFL